MQRYVSVLVDEGRSPGSVNQRLSAIRKLVQEAADNGLLGTFEAKSIARVKGIKKQGRRTGAWLSRMTSCWRRTSPRCGACGTGPSSAADCGARSWWP